MAISKVKSASIATDAVGPTQLNEASNYAFTGTVTGASGNLISEVDAWYVDTNVSLGNNTETLITDWTRYSSFSFAKKGTGMSVSSGIWTFPSTGYWEISSTVNCYTQGDQDYPYSLLEATTNNSSYSRAILTQRQVKDEDMGANTFYYMSFVYIFDCQDTSNYKVKFRCNARNANTTLQSTPERSSLRFVKLNDT